MGLFDSIFGGGFSSPISLSKSPIGSVIGSPGNSVLTEVLAEILAEMFSPDKQKNRSLEKGDVIGVGRGLYEHYGVYIGNDRIIHYTSKDSDASGENTIMETGFSHFMRGSDKYFILNLEYVEPRKYSRLVDAEKKGLLSGKNDLLSIAIRAWEKCEKREVLK